ncbi:MAG: amidohydrolase [Halioglobus sp.]
MESDILKSYMRNILCSMSLLLVACGEPAEVPNKTADQVLLNGRIYTVDEYQEWAEAVAIANGVIEFVGSSSEVKHWIGPQTKVEDLQGKMLLPGFVDSHSHIFLGAAHIDDLVLDQFAPLETWLDEIKSFADQNPEREVLSGYGFLASSFGHEGPTRQILDVVVPDRPVIILDEGMHGAWLNSAALARLGINARTPDPKPGFDYYMRDASGEPTGYLLEGTLWKAIDDLGLVTVESMSEKTAEVIRLYNSYGITAVFDAGPWEAEELQADILANIVECGKLNIRFLGSYYIYDRADQDSVIDKVLALRDLTADTPYTINTLKIMVDGTLEGRTAAMFEDYQGEPGNSGETVFTVEELNLLVSRATAEDLDIHFHALGERAVSESLDAIELARQRYPDSPTRYTLSHIQLMAREDVKRFSKYGVIAQSTPLWARHDAEGREFITEDQFNRYYLFKSLANAGVKLTFGSDYPSTGEGDLGISPLYNMETGHTRQFAGRPEAPIQPPVEERLSIAELIKAYTINGAFQMRMSDRIGSISVGKQADMVLLNQNLFEVDPYEIHKVKILKTWLAGKIVYQSALSD